MNVRRWGVFNLVGMGGFVLQMMTIAIATRWLHWPSVTATIVGLEIAALHNFAGHSRFTWADERARSIGQYAGRFLRYQLAKTTSLAINLAITMVLIAVARLPAEIANTIAVLMCAFPNYFIAERFVFSTNSDGFHSCNLYLHEKKHSTR